MFWQLLKSIRSVQGDGWLGYGGCPHFNPRKALKVCSIKRVELGNAIAQHGGGELGIEDVASCQVVFAKKGHPPVHP